MTKKHFILLADAIKYHHEWKPTRFSTDQLETLITFCKSTNSRFDRNRWLNYIAGTCGPNGGKVKVSK